MGMDFKPSVDLMAAVPADLRERIVSGMRWTLWLAALSVPLGYASTVLLARVGPQVIGTYGLLTVYISVTSVFFFLGGNAVAIRFIPTLDAGHRLSFLISYFVVICAATLPFQIAASLWPSTLQYLLGKGVGAPFGVLLVWLAPLCILFSLALAGLKGMMEIRWAQALSRIVTVGSFSAYAVLYLAARSFLATHYTEFIWGLYLTLAAVITVIAVRRLLALNIWRRSETPLRFSLPEGFWPFTLGLQASSILGFLSTRLDYIFVLNAGGLVVLGHYVALMTLVLAVPMFATFVLDSLLPSLTNTLTLGDSESARQLTEIYLRFMLPCGLAAACFMMLFAHPLIRLLGPRYQNLVDLLLLAIPFGAVQIMNWFTGTVLSAIGQPHSDAVAKAVQTVVFCVSFWTLWGGFHLLGAVLAWGLAEVSYQCLGLYLLIRKRPFDFALWPSYGPFLVVISLAALLAKLIGGYGLIFSLGIGALLVSSFLLSARYTWDEIYKLARLVMPARPA
jgi:O-antigen/teichoic acid export membrane protein